MNSKNCDVMTLAGTRPELIKLSLFVKQFTDLDHAYVYTGQHYSKNMRDIFFDEFDSLPDVDLSLNTSDVMKIKSGVVELLQATKPSLLIVYGDTNSSLAGALAAKETDTKLVHIEAGLRSFDMRMPEEVNRIRIDNLSNYLFCPTSISREYLQYENITKNVYVMGNLIVDVCKKINMGNIEKFNLPKDFILLTLHRKENVDDVETLLKLQQKLQEIGQYQVVFPVHPRTTNLLKTNNIKFPTNVILIEPLGYSEFIGLLNKSKLVLTDSGGLQEEAIILKKPCITFRNTTERPETILLGANRLYPLLKNQENFANLVDAMYFTKISEHPYGDSVAVKISNKIKTIINKPNT
jgi:UDP-N-acetylglucosamine 2-epimerase (non-hydrolysing)